MTSQLHHQIKPTNNVGYFHGATESLNPNSPAEWSFQLYDNKLFVTFDPLTEFEVFNL